MTEEQLAAFTALANGRPWQVASEIFMSMALDIREPHDERIVELCKQNPAAAYIGRLMAASIVEKFINTVDRFKEGKGVKDETSYL